MIGPVQAVVHSERHSASHGDEWQIVKQSSCTCVRRHRGAGQCDQVGDLTAVEGQFQDSLLLDDLPNALAPRLHQRRVRLNLDLLRHLTYFQHQIDHRSAVHLQHNSRLQKCAKSRQSRFQLIRAQRQVWKNVRSGFIRDGVSQHPRVRLRCDNLDAWQNRAALVSDATADLGRRLRPDRRRIQRENKQHAAHCDNDCFHRSSSQSELTHTISLAL